jgi:ABC-2 type transport system permease protein
MDFYRMVRTRCFYGVLLVAMILILLTSYFEYEEELESGAETVETVAESEEENVNIGISVNIAAAPGEKVSVYDIFYANTQGKFTALFLVIFTVMFTTADLTSGYIKNIAGQVENRWRLVVSKVCVVFIYTVILLAAFVLFQAVCNKIVMGYVLMGDKKQLLLDFGTQVLLHFALAMVCMMIAIVIRNNVFSMILSICLCMNVMTIVYSAADKLIQKFSGKEVHLLRYTVTGKMSLLPQNVTVKDSMGAAVVSVVFIAAAFFITGIVFEKRDI